jgi:DNA-binding transcriptional regulator YdaS (Cro superfamily)
MRRKIQPLIDFVNNKTHADQAIFAKSLGISRGYLQQVAYGFSLASPALAKRIAKATDSKVSLIELRPDIFGDDPIEESYPVPAA